MDKKQSKYTVLLIPAITIGSLINGVVSGIMSVITAYFFKPLWTKLVARWSKND